MDDQHTRPAAKGTKVDSTVDRLRRAILAGEIAPGEWLPQKELAERFGISPIPIREALRRLEADGLVEHVPRRGVKVVAYTVNVAQEYYDLRAMLEPYALGLVGARMTPGDLHALRALVAQAQQYLAASDMAALTECNWEFHEELLRLCGSRLVQVVLSRVRRSFQFDTLLLIPDRAAASVREHELIVDALADGRTDDAAQLMRLNIENARQAMLARLPALGVDRTNAANYLP